jgi:hypothetical protein
MISDAEWQERAKHLLRSELSLRGLTYRMLADKLRKKGANLTVEMIANRISRGTFSAAFLLQCLDALGKRRLSLHPKENE